MLRKISAAEPKLVITGFTCVEQQPPPDPPPASLETEDFGGRPRPPTIVITNDGDFVSGVTYNTPPVCPVPTRKSYFDPLTQTTKYYYTYGRAGVTIIPPECGGGFGSFG